jgi:hypothetical protein
MKVFLLPHHPLDPRFRYCLEREHPLSRELKQQLDQGQRGFVRRWFGQLAAWLRYLKLEYDYLVHGHEQIRLSRLLLLMDRDRDLTIVVPEGMSRAQALEAVRGVVRAGLMRHRAHVARNLLAAFWIQLLLFIVIPTHVLAFLFLPVILAYFALRFREDLLIRRTLAHLLDVRLTRDEHRLARDRVLQQLEAVFERIPRPEEAYQEAVRFLDLLDGSSGDGPPLNYALVAQYYFDIGRLDPYERFQDRVRKKIVQAFKRAALEMWNFWRRLLGWPTVRHAPDDATDSTALSSRGEPQQLPQTTALSPGLNPTRQLPSGRLGKKRARKGA